MPVHQTSSVQAPVPIHRFKFYLSTLAHEHARDRKITPHTTRPRHTHRQRRHSRPHRYIILIASSSRQQHSTQTTPIPHHTTPRRRNHVHRRGHATTLLRGAPEGRPPIQGRILRFHCSHNQRHHSGAAVEQIPGPLPSHSGCRSQPPAEHHPPYWLLGRHLQNALRHCHPESHQHSHEGEDSGRHGSLDC